MEKLKRFNNEKGFTMIELIIVIALIAVIGAMLVPNFSETVKRTKIKTDINSLRTIQNAIDLYEAEANTNVTDIKQLADNGYLPKMPKTQYNTSDTSYKLEKVNNNTIVVYSYTTSDEFISNYISTLDETLEKVGDSEVYLK